MLKRISVFIFLLIFSSILFAQDADLVIKNANIYTINKKQPQAEAIAIQHNKIIFVGSEQGAKKYIG